MEFSCELCTFKTSDPLEMDDHTNAHFESTYLDDEDMEPVYFE